MSIIFEIGLTPEPQSFSVTLGGTPYSLTVQWRDPAPGWVLDIADVAGVPIVQGIPLVTGADLLAQYTHLGIPGRLHVQTDSVTDAVPTLAGLGTDSHLYAVFN